jgi:hypothetical protein
MIWRRVLFWLVLLVTIAAFPILFILLKQSDELGSKPENSFLQALEVQNRGTPVGGDLILKRHDEYCAVGIPVTSGKRWVWVLLNPKYQPFQKEMPGGEDYRISRDQLNWLKGQCEISEPVVQMLERHIQQDR